MKAGKLIMDNENRFDSKWLELDAPATAAILEAFVKEELKKAGFKKAVIGLSGGVDSALAAAITVGAIGAENLKGVMMPYKSSNPNSLKDAEAVAAHLGIETCKVEITPMVDAFFDTYEKDANGLRRGNVMARNRMIVLYDFSSKDNSLVMGTGNKTEILLGYSTMFGDSAYAINPIADLYKTQVWALSKHYGIPAGVIEKAPSADLWEGQTDEDELGFSYETADQVLFLMVDQRMPLEKIVDMGFSEDVVNAIARRMKVTQFKRNPPIMARLDGRTVGKDFRYPTDWGK